MEISISKIDFPGAVYVPITDTDIASLKSLYTLFDKYLDHMQMKFEQNCLSRNTQHFELFGHFKERTPFFCDIHDCSMLM